MLLTLLLRPAVMYFLVAAVTVWHDRHSRRGCKATVWALVLATPRVFAAYTVAALRWPALHGTMLLDGASGPVGQTLGDTIVWIGVSGPLWSIPFGVIGAYGGRNRPALLLD